MVLLFRPPAGEEYRVRRKMVWFLMWFIVSELITDIHLVSATVENHENFQKVSNDIPEVQKNSSSSHTNSKASSVVNDIDSQLEPNRKVRAVPPRVKVPNKESYSWDSLTDESLGYVRKIPIHIVEFQRIKVPRPGRSDSIEEDTEHLALFDYRKRNEDGKKRNTVIPMPRFGRSFEEDLTTLGIESLEDKHILSKKSNTIIPIARPGRGSNKIKRDVSPNIIPYPRLGRFSTRYSDQDLTEDEVKTNLMERDKVFADVEYDDLNVNNPVQKRQDVEASNTIIPYPRPGRSYSDNILSQIKRESTEYLVPQIRYGRSMLLLSTTKNNKSAKEKPHTFVLPYPRPGRSNEEEGVRVKYTDTILPYPRPGRTNEEQDINERSLSNENKRQYYMLPTARFGRSVLNSRLEDENILDMGEAFLGLKVNPLFLKNVSEKSKDFGDSGSSFVIPYPRPGKKSTSRIQNSNKIEKVSNADNKKLTDYVLPYPRPGKKFSIEPPVRKFKNINSQNEKSEKQNFILPYPRPGRSYHDWIGKENTKKYQDIQNEDYEIFEDNYQNTDEPLDDSDDSNGSEMDTSKLEGSSINFRFKRSNTVVPYPRFGRSNFVVPYPRLGRSNTIVPYPRLGRSNSVVPYPRPGRSSDYIVPYPRLGRSNTVVPYPRPGRSDSVIPYPRPGRSNSVIPYPRMGRSNSIVPYPRMGRSNSIVPYPRPGRSNSIVPYPRPGRSNSVIPYPRLGRSNYVVPYPRLGRSNTVVPYPRLGRSNTVIPYPRLGRSASYPSPKRYNSYNDAHGVDESYSVIPSASKFDFPSLRLRKSNYITPYPRPGRSQDVKLFSINNKQKDFLPQNLREERDYSEREDTYIIPYPRPGRLIEKKESENNMILPYPRPGRSNENGSGYVLPYPRIGRSASIEFNDNEKSVDGSVIPFPPVESPLSSSSVHKLNKHMITNSDDSIYILPYPRPGRYSE